ncbi:MAG: dihydroorotase [Oscillospiraceae bacterium]|nr:dihydroorotase [Oscillospiraceae bacterium]
MDFDICGGNVYIDGEFKKRNLSVRDGFIVGIFSGVPADAADTVFQLNNCFIFPGFLDVHVHLREPGFSYKETIETGTLAAAHGGFTSVCAMPNLSPVPDCADNLRVQREIIDRSARVRVYPYGSITRGQAQRELSDMEELAREVIAFSDDGVGVASAEMMERAMVKAKALGKMIVAHCEIPELTRGGFLHDGAYARAHGFIGNPSESEWRMIERDLELVAKTLCNYHICHVSARESVELIRRAKAAGLPVSCETAPHYLLLCDEDLRDDGAFRMNPPIRGRADREALVEGIIDGTIDMIATDHAPHSPEEKAGGLAGSLNGIVGLETAFPALFTGLVKPGTLGLTRLLELMQSEPARRFGIGNRLAIGEKADLTVFDLEREFTIEPEGFLSKGRSTPFGGMKVFGKCLLTAVGGEIVHIEQNSCK